MVGQVMKLLKYDDKNVTASAPSTMRSIGGSPLLPITASNSSSGISGTSSSAKGTSWMLGSTAAAASSPIGSSRLRATFCSSSAALTNSTSSDFIGAASAASSSCFSFSFSSSSSSCVEVSSLIRTVSSSSFSLMESAPASSSFCVAP
ncbi:hypothetical protein E2C01_027310 [Portunus trituberculatus]|uniref:Uncharacterized protein n=1 Tax=Portunus trituberculatus TaxID=210409 RepID=A0A5B7EHU4_PORTR|nr:hypothetical protein [Portunus trituberculatus]